MATSDKDNKNPRKKTESVKDRAEKAIEAASKPKKSEVRSESSKKESSKKRSFKIRNKDKKDRKPRRFHIIPKFLRLAFAEIKLVTWPNTRTTYRLTVAVIIFATIFSLLITLVDWGFGHIFKKVFLHG